MSLIYTPISNLFETFSWHFLIIVNASPSIITDDNPMLTPICTAWEHARASVANEDATSLFRIDFDTRTFLVVFVIAIPDPNLDWWKSKVASKFNLMLDPVRGIHYVIKQPLVSTFSSTPSNSWMYLKIDSEISLLEFCFPSWIRLFLSVRITYISQQNKRHWVIELLQENPGKLLPTI